MLTDDILRYAVRLQGVAAGLHRGLAADVDRALADLERQLARRLPDDESFTMQRLQLLRAELAALSVALGDSLADRVYQTTAAVAETTLDRVQDELQDLVRS